MTQPLSLYLDLVRTMAAFIVVLSHLGYGHLIGGHLWFFTCFGNEAVMVFFVLSGLVIGYVTDQRELTLSHYATARLARLYSVILPAMVLTLILDGVGYAMNLGGHDNSEAIQINYHSVAGYLTSLVMINQSWSLDLYFGTDGPYWSIPYEFWYYFLFAATIFMHGWGRSVALVVGALIAGPKILCLLPVWLAGVVVYRVARLNMAMHPWHIGFFAAGLTGMLLMLHADAASLGKGSWLGVEVGSLSWKYLFGSLFALHLLGAAGIARGLKPLPDGFAAIIRAMAGGTFALYLFHLPVIAFLEAVSPFDQKGIVHHWLLLSGPLFLAYTLGSWCEKQKTPLRALLMNGFERLSSK